MWNTPLLPFCSKVDLGAMAMKEYSTFPKFSIARASLSDGFMPYPEHLGWWSYPSAETQSVYSKAPADWAYL